ncbi:TPA: RND transporter [Raoultella planticola ATCC 33531]
MNLKNLLIIGISLTALARYTYAIDCQPNSIGGQFCINDDGTTSDSMPNEIGGIDTYSQNGNLTSTVQATDGNDEMLDGSIISTQDSPLNDTLKSKSDSSDDPLRGRDWNSPSNLNTDGAATSSFNR